MDPSRDTVAHVLGYIYFQNTPASLFGAFWEVVRGNTDCVIAAVSLSAGGEGYIRGLVPCWVARWGDAPE